MDNNLLWFWLCNIKGIGIGKTKRLLKNFGSPQNIWDACKKEYEGISHINKQDIKNIVDSKDENRIYTEYSKLIERKIRFISVENEEYPDKLKSIYDPPYGLYVKGQMPSDEKPSIAIIGARKCSSYGKELAEYFSRELSNNGFQIISGLARGIDSCAHRGALSGNGLTYGVLGNGLNICYPQENINLLLEVEEKGGVISEFPLDSPPIPAHFPLRNRIISALSDGILVVEAAERSGSLITVDLGLEQGKDIFAIPGRLRDTLSQGTNKLIKAGAKMVVDIHDIIEEYNYFANKIKCEKQIIYSEINKLLEKNEKIVYDCLSLEPKHIDKIVVEVKKNINEVSHILFMLELKEVVKQLPNKHFIKTI